METIKDKSGNVLRYKEKVYLPNGRTKTFSSKKKTEVKRWKEEFKTKLREQQKFGIPMETDESLEKYALYWLEKVVKQGCSPSTHCSYRGHLLNHVLPVLGHKVLKQITPRDVTPLVNLLLEKGHCKSGVNFIISTLKRVLNHGVSEGILIRSPLHSFKNLKVSSKPMKYWAEEDAIRFLNYYHDTSIGCVVFFSLNTGCRKGETCALTWDKVDLQSARIEISAHRDRYGFKETTKTGRIRYLSLNRVLLEFLKNLATKKKSQFVFTNEDGCPVNPHQLNRIFKKAQVAAGISNVIRFHDLRHTFASHFAMNDGTIYALQQALGHTKSETTQRYAHLSTDYMKRQMELVTFTSDSPFLAPSFEEQEKQSAKL